MFVSGICCPTCVREHRAASGVLPRCPRGTPGGTSTSIPWVPLGAPGVTLGHARGILCGASPRYPGVLPGVPVGHWCLHHFGSLWCISHVVLACYWWDCGCSFAVFELGKNVEVAKLVILGPHIQPEKGSELVSCRIKCEGAAVPGALLAVS